MAKARRRLGGSDAGITLIEVLVSTIVMSIALSIFTTAMIQVMHTSDRVQTVSQAQSQVNLVFLRLDRGIRYASAISDDGMVGADQYVEYLNTTTNNRTCTELRVHGKVLQTRTWTQPAPPTVPGPANETASPWVPLVSTVTSTAPFAFWDAGKPDSNGAVANFQRLELDLSVGDPTGGKATTRETHVTFTALNTSLKSKNDIAECTELRSIP